MTKNTNVPPLGRTFTQGAASCGACAVLPWGEIRLCTLHATAPALLEALETLAHAVDRLRTINNQQDVSQWWAKTRVHEQEARTAISRARGENNG